VASRKRDGTPAFGEGKIKEKRSALRKGGEKRVRLKQSAVHTINGAEYGGRRPLIQISAAVGKKSSSISTTIKGKKSWVRRVI